VNLQDKAGLDRCRGCRALAPIKRSLVNEVESNFDRIEAKSKATAESVKLHFNGDRMLARLSHTLQQETAEMGEAEAG
jgi:hypothetical protein